ncbi:hypothetical protein BKCO1_37000155 [Neofusicoccum parvum]|nr:hypothetical protein BKCO1_37000155 [Neofusicoccum parvum]
MNIFRLPVASTLDAVGRFGADKVMGIATDVINKVSADSLRKFMDGLSSALNKLSPSVLLHSLGQVTRTVLSAIVKKVGQLNVVRDGVMSNKLNELTISFLWTQRHELVNFIVDIVECAKCYVKSTSLDGQRDLLEEHGTDNELDISMPMNQHALLCQAQRLVKSLVYLFTNVAEPLSFENIDMSAHTQLATDTFHSGTIIEVTPSGYQTVSAIPDTSAKGRRRDSGVGEPGITMSEHAESSPNEASGDGNDNKARITDEKWLFVNGVGTELFWLHLACRKLAKRFSRDVTGVYNRGDGILWDLIECAGQRTRYGYRCAESQKCIVQTTASSRAAQIALVNQLEDALVKSDDGATYKYVVMVAHSQGCLVLRLALEQLLKSGSESVQKVMRERLCVFTFGNPSVEWKIGSAQVLHTEHFANEKDFVAKLGVMYDDQQTERGFTNVFVNKEKEWTGHLFGTQYSLKPQHYIDGFQVKGSNRSWLLNCLEGESIDVARVSFILNRPNYARKADESIV